MASPGHSEGQVGSCTVTTTVEVNRSALDQSTFESLYRNLPNGERPEKEKSTLTDKVKGELARQCTWREFGRFWVNRFPCIDWIRHYDVKRDLLADVIAGFTIAIFQVPQGMAYAMLANVPPVYGLYTSFFPVLTYALMGTSRQASIGTFAITSLMTGVMVNRYQSNSGGGTNSNGTQPNDTSFVGDPDDPSDPGGGLTAIQVATAIALVCGVLQILFGVLRLGSLAVFLSEHLVSGFTCGSAVHVLSSQIKTIFGVKLKVDDSGFLGLIYLYIDFFTVIVDTNLVTLALSAVTLLILIFFKEFVNEKTKKISPVPFPIELVLVVISTLVSSYMNLNEDHKLGIVGHIQQGFPAPSVPAWETLTKVAAGSVALSIVGFSSTLSLGKIFANKYNYEIEPNQDCFALGTANIIGSIFSCIPCSASISRSSVQDGAGARTQLVSLINCAGLLVVLLALGSLLEPLPSCILSCIIVVSLKGMILLSKDFYKYWKVSKVDGAIWMVTFLGVLFLDVDVGLGVGMGFALLTLIYRTVRPKHEIRGPIPDTELFAGVELYHSAGEVPGTKIWFFGGPLHFANADYFVEQVEKLAQLSRLRKLEKDAKKTVSKGSSAAPLKSQVTSKDHMKSSVHSVTPIILEDYSAEHFSESREYQRLDLVLLDCSSISYVDLAGVKAVKAVFKELDKYKIKVYMASCSERMLTALIKDEFFQQKMSTHIFPSLTDALARHVNCLSVMEGRQWDENVRDARQVSDNPSK